MTLVTRFLNQSAAYEKYTGTNKWGVETYEASRPIRCRIVLKKKLLEDSDSSELVDQSEYLTDFETFLKDKIDGQQIRSIKTITGLKSIEGWKSYPHAPSGFSN